MRLPRNKCLVKELGKAQERGIRTLPTFHYERHFRSHDPGHVGSLAAEGLVVPVRRRGDGVAGPAGEEDAPLEPLVGGGGVR